MSQESYSNARLKYTLTHYSEILQGKVTLEEIGEFHKGSKNPLETALIMKADLDQAMSSLSPRGDIWAQACQSMSVSLLIHLGRMDKRDDNGNRIPYPLSSMQRALVNDCILKGCGKICKRTCGEDAPETCWNEGIISRMRRTLNKENRDSGRYSTAKLTPQKT